MAQQLISVLPKRDLAVKREMLDQAGLKGRLRVVILPGEIRILPEVEPTTEQILDRLAGCLGEERAEDYDFGLKIGGFYETR